MKSIMKRTLSTSLFVLLVLSLVLVARTSAAWAGTHHGNHQEEEHVQQEQTLCAKDYCKSTATSCFQLEVTGCHSTLSYKCSDTQVAKISSTGQVTILRPGCTQIKIHASSCADYKAADKTITLKVNPRKVKSVTACNTAGTCKLKVSWKKQSNVSKYQICYAKNSSFKNCKTVTVSSDCTSKTLTKLTKGTKYYVKVRAVKSCDGHKHCGKWSTYTSCRTK